MNIISTFNDKRFTLNGIQYFKNYVSVVRGNKVEIFNCYERKDVLVELAPYNQFSLNGTIYTSAVLLQEALLPVIYSRANMGDGNTFTQNNIGRTISLGFYMGDSSVQAIVTKMNNITTVISATDTPVILSLYTLPTIFVPNQTPPNSKKYLYLFKPGTGTYGLNGTKVTAAMISQLATLTLTPEDIQSNPKAVIHNLGTLTNETFIQVANKSIWDFSDSGEIDDDGQLKTYYFSYSKNDVLYFDQFKGTPGIYGFGKVPLTERELVATTNSGISSNPTLEQILAEGGNKNISQFTNNGDGISPYSTVAKLNGLTITVNQAAAEMYLKNSDGSTLATVNLAFLNNEGTTFFYNETTKKLELKNDAGTILSEVPVSAFVSNLMQTVNFNGANSSILEFKDAAGNVVDSASFTINNIAGLQTALNAKANLIGGNFFSGNQTINGDFGVYGQILSDIPNGTLTQKTYRNGQVVSSIGSSSSNTDLNGILQLYSTPGDDAIRLYSTGNSWINGGNIGFGTKTPSARLDVNGNINIANGKNLTWGGTYESGNPTIAANEIGIGFYPSGDDTALYITHEKNIGINKVNPSYMLDVNGIGRFKRTEVNGGGLATASIIATNAKTINDGILQAFQAHNSADSEVTYSSISTNIDSSTAGIHAGSLEFRTSNAGNTNLALKLSKEGNVGIGIYSPQAKLDVNGSGNFSGEVTIPDGTALGSAVNKSQLNLKADNNGSLNVKGAIPVNANLNDYKETGIYTQNSDSAAANGTNYPITLSGKLEVVRNYIDNTMSYQTYHTYGSGNTIYHRTYYNGNWSDWNELTHSNDITNAVTALSSNIASNYISKTGAVTKDGIMTFNSSPIVPNAISNNNAVNLGQLGINSGDTHEKGYLKSATFIGNASANYQDNDLIGSKIKYIIYFRNSESANYSVAFINPQNYTFNSVTGTIGFIMDAPSYIVVNYVK